MKTDTYLYRIMFRILVLVSLIAMVSACGSSGGVLEGTITNGNTPASGITVRLMKVGSGTETTTAQTDAAIDKETQTDANGKYVFEEVAAGQRFIEVGIMIGENRCIVFSFTEVKVNERVTLDITIPERVTLAGPVSMLPGGELVSCKSWVSGTITGHLPVKTQEAALFVEVKEQGTTVRSVPFGRGSNIVSFYASKATGPLYVAVFTGTPE